MTNINLKNLKSILLIFCSFVFLGLIIINFSQAQANSPNCPDNTLVGENDVILVGEIINDGGDSNLTVWFQYGKTTSYEYSTTPQKKSGVGRFCTPVYNLESCTTYHYRAVAQNSAGVAYGKDEVFTTKCSSLPVVDLKINNSDGPVTVYYLDYITLSWSSQNAISCSASGDWSGNKPLSGSETKQLNLVGNYTFTLTCQNNNGQTNSDTVRVIVLPKIPIVITKPAVVTY